MMHEANVIQLTVLREEKELVKLKGDTIVDTSCTETACDSQIEADLNFSYDETINIGVDISKMNSKRYIVD